MTRIQIEHETTYGYQTDVELAHHLAYLHPLTSRWQKIISADFVVEPNPTNRSEGRDVFGNVRTFFTIAAPHLSLSVRASSVVELDDPYVSLNLDESPAWEEVAESLSYVLDRPYVPATEFVFASPHVPRLEVLKQYALESFKRGRPIGLACLDLNERIFKDFTYSTTATTVDTPIGEAFNKRAGVCQDFSHILIGCLRALGLSAQYVSGYLLTQPAPGTTKLRGSDASHAWVSVYCPGVPGNWLELDPTNNVIARNQHVRLAVGRDFGDVSPLRGVIRGGGDHSLKIAVTCEEIDI